MTKGSPTRFLFGDCELDVEAYELRRESQPIRLERRPMDLLLLLLQRRGQLVSRTDIASHLWGSDVFIDVDLGVNTAVRKVRNALRDDPDTPRYIETVSGKGYRFIAPVQAVAARAETPQRTTLAVLPFENLGGDPAHDYLADGLTEEVIAATGHIDPDQLAVIGRTSVNHYRETAKSLAEIGAELHAEYLLEGSLRVEGDRFRITSRLIATHDQSQAWSATYDSQPGSVLTLQRELSVAIAEQVRLKVLPDRQSATARAQTQNAEAYDLYLRGRHQWYQLTPATTRRALEYFRKATELDADYALAWSGIADAYSSSPINGDQQPTRVWNVAREAVTQAVRSAPNLAESQISLGFLNLFLDWNWPLAEAAFRRAIELDRNLAIGHRMLGVQLSHLGRHEEAMRSMRRARELDPFYAMHHALSTLVAYHAGDYTSAIEFGRQAIVTDPEFWIGYFQIAQVYEHVGKTDLALEAISNAAKLGGGNSKTLALRGHILAKNGRADEAREQIATLETMARDRYVPPYATALILAGLDDREAALDWLDRAFDARDVHLVFLPIDPKWDPYRKHPRFAALLDRCNFHGK